MKLKEGKCVCLFSTHMNTASAFKTKLPPVCTSCLLYGNHYSSSSHNTKQDSYPVSGRVGLSWRTATVENKLPSQSLLLSPIRKRTTWAAQSHCLSLSRGIQLWWEGGSESLSGWLCHKNPWTTASGGKQTKPSDAAKQALTRTLSLLEDGQLMLNQGSCTNSPSLMTFHISLKTPSGWSY